MSAVDSVPSLSLPGSIADPNSIPTSSEPSLPINELPSRTKPAPINDQDLYAVPESDTADFVGIGSLGHIIRKCFKEIYYPEPPPGSSTILPSEPSTTTNVSDPSSFIVLDEATIDTLDEEEKRIYQEKLLIHQTTTEENNATDQEDEDDKELETDRSEMDPENDNDNKKEEEKKEEQTPATDDNEDPNAPPAPYDIEVPLEPPILPLPIAFKAKEQGNVEKDRIDNGLRERVAQARALLLHLDDARDTAMKADEDDRTEMLDEHGLLLQTEIPRGPSHLALDPDQLSGQWPKFGSNLILASELFRKIDAKQQARTGTLSPEAMEKAMKSADVPHYMQITGSMAIRRGINETIRDKRPKQRAAMDAKTLRLREIVEKREAENDPALAAAKHPPPREAQLKMGKKKPIMRSDDREVNEKILQRMQSKLDFTRNPRFDMTKRNKSTYGPNQIFGGKAGGGGNGLGNTLADLTTAHIQPPTVESDMAFKVEPEKIQFTDYEIGGQYETTVYFHNVTPVMRRLKLLPPRTKFFALSMVEFPSEEGGLVAPGMSVKVTVRFMPDSLADYQDALLCTSETNRFKVMVEAYRPPPTLSIPLVLDCGCCLIGAKETVTFKCTNYGGAGRFRLLPDDQWPHPSGDASDANQPMRLAPFLIEPAEFELLPNETIDIKVHHFPKLNEEISRKFVMVCDNCQVKTFTARGTGCRVSISVNGMAGLSVDATVPNAVVPQEVLFDPVTPGATAVQDLSILNLTPLKLAYRWEITDGEGTVVSRPITADNGGSQLALIDPSSIFEISPSNGLLALNGTTHFEVSFAPEAATMWPGHARLVIEGVPPMAVDDVDTVSIQAMGQNVQAALKDVLGGNSLSKSSKRKRNRKRGVPTAVIPDAPEVEDPFSMEILLKDIACLALGVHGAGKQSELGIVPNVSMLPGPILPDMPTSFTLTVTNLSDAEVGYDWQPGRYRTKECDGKPFTLLYTPPTGRLQPLEVVSVTVEFTAHTVGMYDIDLPCLVESGPKEGICGRVVVEVIGPTVNIIEPEIDFGLIGVGECSELQVHLHNVSAVDAKWNFNEMNTDEIRQALSEIAEREQNQDNERSSTASSSRSLTHGINKDKLCRILFNPSSGVLGPGKKTPVTVMCFSGQLPQRLRFPLECNVEHSNQPTFCRSRAEVQAPKVYIKESIVDLKNTYIGVPVETTIHVKNLSNLPAEFKFSRVIDKDNENIHNIFDIQFSPNEGCLSEKEELTVTIRYKALKAGRVNCMFALDVAGMEFPLGFQLNTISKGLLVTYTLQNNVAELVRPCAPLGLGWKDTNPPAEGCKEPNARIVPVLDFGEECPLQKRRRLQLVIRNYSAIPTSYSLSMKSYPGAPTKEEEEEASQSNPRATLIFEPSAPSNSKNNSALKAPGTAATGATSRSRAISRGTSKRSGTRASKRNNGIILGDKHETTQQYRSKNGRAYTENNTQAKLDQSTLRMGRGAAFIITPCVGRLPPWGSVTVDVVSCNDMPGSYRDELVSLIEGLPEASLRAKMTVVGTPLSLSNTCVGLNQQCSPPIFAWGNLLRSANETSRYLKVVNSGPIPCNLNWIMKGIYEEPPLLDIGLETTGDKDMPINLVVSHHPPNPPPPFTVYPQDATIPAYGMTSFEVTFVPPDACDSYKAIMHADASYDFGNVNRGGVESEESGTSSVGDISIINEDGRTTPISTGRSNASNSKETSKKGSNDGAGPDLPGCLTVACSATTIIPALTVHKAKRVDTSNFNFDEISQFVKFKAWSTHGNNNPSHFRTLNMNNLCGTPLTFTVSAGKFVFESQKVESNNCVYLCAIFFFFFFVKVSLIIVVHLKYTEV